VRSRPQQRRFPIADAIEGAPGGPPVGDHGELLSIAYVEPARRSRRNGIAAKIRAKHTQRSSRYEVCIEKSARCRRVEAIIRRRKVDSHSDTMSRSGAFPSWYIGREVRQKGLTAPERRGSDDGYPQRWRPCTSSRAGEGPEILEPRTAEFKRHEWRPGRAREQP